MESGITRRALLGGGAHPQAASDAAAGERDINMCGVLVHALPHKLDAVRAALCRIDGVAVHKEAGSGRLIVTVEDTPSSSAADSLAEVHKVPGVVAAALVYHQFEPARQAARNDQECCS